VRVPPKANARYNFQVSSVHNITGYQLLETSYCLQIKLS
jgi:hypothetical protein